MQVPNILPKYGNQKTAYQGIQFDSKKEANRWAELRLLERAGKISNLERQVKFELIPSQYIDNKCVERAVNYVADFVYTDKSTGKKVVEDVKGYRNANSAGYAKFVIKRKLMLWIHNIQVSEV